MNPLRQQMVEEMQLRRLSESTQRTYLHAVKQLAIWAEKSPEAVTAEEMRSYFLYLTTRKSCRVAAVTR